MKQILSQSWLRGLAAALGAGALLSMSAPQQVAAKPALIAGAQYDLTGNQVINAADVGEVASQWRTLLEGEALAANLPNADVTVNGIVDISDVQLVASQAGQGTTEQALRALATRATPSAVADKEFVVNSASAGDPNKPAYGDANLNDGICATSSGSCTLQAALQQANAPRPTPYRAVIRFNIRDSGGGCPNLVQIVPNLDSGVWLRIDDSSGLGTVIDGYSQCGARANTNDIEGNAIIKIELIGTKFGKNGEQYEASDRVNGLEIKSPNNIVRGLALYKWDRVFELTNGANYNHIEGNFIGTDATNTYLNKPRTTNKGEGIRLQDGANFNVIGCGSVQANGTFTACTDRAQVNAARNIIAGNGNDGIHLQGNDVTNNHVVGNYIGLSQSGRVNKNSTGASLNKNYADGVDFENGANNNWLGGESDLERNWIAGNGSDGIEISHNSTTVQNRVVNNYFGLNPFAESVSNGDNGISFEDTVNHNYAYKNVVGGNKQSGIRGYVLAAYNEIYNNFVGVLPDGSTRANGRHGVYLMGGSHHNMVRNNIIGNNDDRGVTVDTDSDDVHNNFGETYFNTISKNSIFGNKREGIKLTSNGASIPLGNQGIAKPEIKGANATLVVGLTCPSCRIEVFIADKTTPPSTDGSGENSGEGKTFVGEGVATGGGEFAVAISGVAPGQILTATTTDSSGNTSEFARNFVVGSGPVATIAPRPTATPSPTPRPTVAPAPVLSKRVWVPVTRR